MGIILSTEDRLVIRHIRHYPSTIPELQRIFGDTPQMKGRLLKLKKAGLVFSFLTPMPKTRLPKNLQPGLSRARQVWFAVPNPQLDHYSNASVESMFELFKNTAAQLDLEDSVTDNARRLIGLDTVLATMYTRYIQEYAFRHQKEEDESE